MLTDIDSELFPDLCEVVAASSQDNCYLIKKNGSSSLRFQAKANGLKVLRNEEIKDLEHITIVVRDPRPRYFSGLYTFVEALTMENRNLDFDSCAWMANRYRFLNRHYLPQFLWVLNLKRYIDPQCHLIFQSMDYLSTLTQYHLNPSPTVGQINVQPDPAMELWFFVDQLLVDSVGKRFTWQELMTFYRNHPGDPLKEICQRVRRLADVLS